MRFYFGGGSNDFERSTDRLRRRVSTHFGLLKTSESTFGELLRPLFGRFRKGCSRKFALASASDPAKA